MRSLLRPALFAACLLALLPAAALAASEYLEEEIAAFVGAPGWERAEAGLIEQALIDQLQDPRSVSPGGSLGPLEKALLLLESEEPPLPRTRTLLRYGQITLDEDGTALPVSFVQVERYNLGPAIRAMAAEEYGAENVGAPEDFGVGPHVAWRFVFMPVMGSSALLLDAARAEIDEPAALGADCLGRGCLEMTVPADDLLPWLESEAPELDFVSPYTAERDGIAVAARAVAELSLLQALATLEGGQYLWLGVEQAEAASDGRPFLFFLEDRDLGQDSASETLLVQSELNDDQLFAFWSRRLQVPGETWWFGAAMER